MLGEIIKALLIEDDENIVILLEEIFNTSGILNLDLKVSYTLTNGIENLKNHNFDVVILDLNLPDSSGFDTLLKVRLTSLEVPVVVLTAADDISMAKNAIENGADDYISKDDFNASILERSIRYSIERKKNQVELEKSKQRFQHVIQGIADWMWECDENWVINFISGDVHSVLGYGRGELLGKPFFHTMYNDDAEFSKNLLGIFAREKKPVIDLNTWHYAKNGEAVCLLTNALPLFDDKNNLKGYRGINKDVTKIKRTDYLLYQKIEEQKALLSSIPAYVHLKDKELKIVTANKAFADLTGFSISELDGKTDYDLFLEQEADYFFELDKKVIEKKQPIFNLEKEITLSNGEKKWHLISKVPYYNENEDVIGIVGTSLDITKRVENEKKIHRLSSAIDQSANTIFITNLDGKIIYANKAIKKTTGYSKEEVINNNLEIEKFKFKPKSIYTEIFDAMAYGEELSSEIQCQKKKGEYVWVELMITPVKDKNNYITNYIVILVDIQKRKKLELERESLINDLKKANESLKEYSQMKDDFLAVASHDLRSPFSAILGYTQFLLSDDRLEQDQKKMVEHIKKSANSQLRYVNDMLDIIKIESGRIKLKKKQYKIKPLIKESSMLLEMLAKRKNIKMKTYIKTNATVKFDYPKVLQVLNNLISNAIKFTPSGGTIKITCFENDKNEIEIHVIDNGIGISEEAIETLFTRYKQHHTNGTAGEKGTGLGLAICKNLVELHGGSIGVNSVYNEGSDFYFTLPK